MAAIALDDKGPTNNVYLDALLMSGWHWSGKITYFFDNDVTVWTSAEKVAYKGALAAWANVANVSFQEVKVEAQANFVEHSVPNSTFAGVTFGDHGTSFNAPAGNQVQGRFNHDRYSFQSTGQLKFSAVGLVPGGFGYETFVHEIGHALGLAHPHDKAGGSGLFPGVALGNSKALGDNSLNQTVYTVMSFNLFEEAKKNATFGYVAGPSAFDIAAIQHLYGTKAFQTGKNTYVLPGTDAKGTYWKCIWDTAGVDTMSYAGNGLATIDLRAATLDNTANGGGFLSSVKHPTTDARIHGGFTIAKGVVIENASGGSNKDTINGNQANNTLAGNGGDDTLAGNAGNDVLIGGPGADSMSGGAGDDGYRVDSARDKASESANNGNDTVIAVVSYALPGGSSIELLRTPNVTNRLPLNLTGNELANKIHGNAAANKLDGKAGADTLVGNGGDDTYVVDHPLDDIIELDGQGSDTAIATKSYKLTEKSSIETLRTQAKTTTFPVNLTGNEIANTIEGNEVGNILNGLAGNDKLTGHDGNDMLFGGVGSDTAFFSEAPASYCLTRNADGSITIEHDHGSMNDGNDRLFGVEFGNFKGTVLNLALTNLNCGSAAGETLRGKNFRSDFLNGGGGDDTLLGDVDNPTEAPFDKGPQNDNLSGGAGNDTLDGFFGRDSLDGGAGNDRLASLDSEKIEPDKMFGGTGIDVAEIHRSSRTLALTLNISNPAKAQALADGTVVKDVERLVYTGGRGTDTITGGALQDVLQGFNGDDSLNGGRGADVLRGQAGDDQLIVDNNGIVDSIGFRTGGDDAIEQNGEGDDQVLTSVSYQLNVGSEIETLSTTDDAGKAALNLTGNEYDQTIIGNAGNNTIDGNPDNLIFNGQQGFDTMRGLGGNDTYIVRAAEDVVEEAFGRGTDTISISLRLYFGGTTYVVKAKSEVEKITIVESEAGNRFNIVGSDFPNTIGGTAGINFLQGRGGNDSISGLDGDDTLDGGLGADTTNGGNGDDIHHVDDKDDVVTEGANGGNDVVIAAASYALKAASQVETLRALPGAAPLKLTGNELANIIQGNAGANQIFGKAGNDKLTGGANKDTFVFDTALAPSNVDIITDYNVPQDTIQLAKASFAALKAGKLASAAFHTGAAAHDADDRIVFNKTTGTLMFDPDGNGAGAAVQFASLKAGLAMTNADFVVI